MRDKGDIGAAQQMVQLLREEFDKLLESKTGWGKNQIKRAFDQAEGRALYRFMGQS